MGFGNKPVKVRRDDALTRVDWRQLEDLLATYYRGQGYDVEHIGTGASGTKFDGGVDLKLRRGAEYVLVQAKHWNAFKVPHNAVHELLGIMVNQGATGAIVVTSGEFTKAAIEAATRHGHVQLIDGEELRQMLGPIPEPASKLPRPQGVAGTFFESTMDRLLLATEQRIRGEARRSTSRVARLGIGFVVAKGLMFLVFVFLIWWGFTMWVGMATRALQPPQPLAAPASPPPSLPTPELEAGNAAVSLVPAGNPRATFRHATPEEIAESQRRADEAMRVLAPNTPGVMRMPRKAE